MKRRSLFRFRPTGITSVGRVSVRVSGAGVESHTRSPIQLFIHHNPHHTRTYVPELATSRQTQISPMSKFRTEQADCRYACTRDFSIRAGQLELLLLLLARGRVW